MKCSRCNKPALKKKDGSSYGFCRKCKREYGREHYRRNKRYYVDKAGRRNKQIASVLKKAVDEAKSRPCIDCGRQFAPCAMDLDHVRGKKLDNVSSLVVKRVSLGRILREIKKCEVRCAVCHRIKTHGCKGSHSEKDIT